MHIYSFPPISTPQARILILGTMPGKMSLIQQQYYAHPRNAFWPIMGELFSFDAREDYALRKTRLMRAEVALWDVLQSCIRESSLDSDIDNKSIVANNFSDFLDAHPLIDRIGFNGAKAAQLFRRHVQPFLAIEKQTLNYLFLPSTSPAHAGKTFSDKLLAWRAIL
ncbi:MAG: DNA-deoxyinosine glycosylase [Verrucomicrobiaceae bacterium]|nr:DNA-deoxyinosine glycosylase [Verrucomicrobiaceae bacterium]